MFNFSALQTNVGRVFAGTWSEPKIIVMTLTSAHSVVCWTARISAGCWRGSRRGVSK